MPRVRTRSRRWCFTLNNYTEEEESMLQSLVSQGSITYVLYGREVGTQHTPHLQGYCETKTRTSLRLMKETLGRRVHLEKANGSLEQNQKYCKKEDENAFEEGTPMQQGRRTDLTEIQSLLDSGVTCSDIADSHFSKWVVYRKSFQAYAARLIPNRSWKTHCTVLWGITGTGKTRFVHNQIMDSTFWSPGDYQWFDGYNGQDIVLFDDYRGEYPLQLLLKLLDRYPMSVPIKGGFTKWSPRKVYITSNVKPLLWYPEADLRSVDAMLRRIESITEVEESIY